MLAGPEDMPSKAAKDLPEAAKAIFAAAYNEDFAWRASEAHALKAAWRTLAQSYSQEDGAWKKIA